jgi:hypothetical protein
VNFQLIKGANTRDVHVINTGDMFRQGTRMRLRDTSREHTNRVEGDGVRLVHPMTFMIRVSEADENIARNTVDAIIAFLEDATDIKRVTTGRLRVWRALNRPCLNRAVARPLSAARNDWAVRLTLLPRFPTWTYVRTPDISTFAEEDRPDIITTGLVAEWRVDEQEGPILTDYWGSLSLNDFLNATWNNRGLDFNGDGYVRRSFEAALNPPQFTTIQVVNPHAVGGLNQYRSPLTSRKAGTPERGFNIYIDPDAHWELWTGTEAGWGIVDLGLATANNWTFIGFSNDGSTTKGYLDGDLVASAAAVYVPQTVNPFVIGAGDSGGSWHWDGEIAYTLFYDRVLTDAEVRQNYLALQQMMGQRGVGI